MQSKRCEHCGKTFVPINERNFKLQKYCCRRCKQKSLLARKAENPDDGYMKRHRARMRETQPAMRQRWKEQGLCSRCGHRNDRIWEGFVTCTNCTEQINGCRK